MKIQPLRVALSISKILTFDKAGSTSIVVTTDGQNSMENENLSN